MRRFLCIKYLGKSWGPFLERYKLKSHSYWGKQGPWLIIKELVGSLQMNRSTMKTIEEKASDSSYDNNLLVDDLTFPVKKFRKFFKVRKGENKKEPLEKERE